MTGGKVSRVGAALAIAAVVGVLGPGQALAQDYQGATATVGGTSGTDEKPTAVAPGVTISGGEVTNETGIGVVNGGGSSVGSSPGGGDNASTVE
jgi:hypothetical protein